MSSNTTDIHSAIDLGFKISKCYHSFQVELQNLMQDMVDNCCDKDEIMYTILMDTMLNREKLNRLLMANKDKSLIFQQLHYPEDR